MEFTSTETVALLTLAVTQAVALIGVIAGVFISVNNGRQLAKKADKADVQQVQKLVNGKTAKLEQMIADKAFKAGVEKEKASLTRQRR